MEAVVDRYPIGDTAANTHTNDEGRGMKGEELVRRCLLFLALTVLAATPTRAGSDSPTTAAVAGTWAMSTRTAPFQMTLSVDATNHVSGTLTAAPGFVDAGTVRGRVVGKYVILSIQQNNGARGDGVLVFSAAPNATPTLVGPVKLDDDSRPLDNWQGEKLRYNPVSKLKVHSTQQAAARDDVDVYDGPGGQHQVIGMMPKGRSAPARDYVDGWCLLDGVADGGGQGWVAVDHLVGCTGR
jgi:hypothetical protein